MPPLAAFDPLTGDVIRAVRKTPNRYERERPGELAHIDVKKLGRIPDGGGWRAHGRSEKVRGRGIGYDYVHALVDDHTRLAYAEIHADEQGATAAGFLLRAADYFAAHGITKLERVISDHAFAYRRSAAFKAAVDRLVAEQRFIKPHCPWTNGKVERFNRTMQTEWAYRHMFRHKPGPPQRSCTLHRALQHWSNPLEPRAHARSPSVTYGSTDGRCA